MKTKVVFRYWEKSVIALFPELTSDVWGTYCESYQHIGQHGAAGYYDIIDHSRPAKPEEYADLKEELEKVYGYEFDVRQRTMPAIHNRRKETARAMWRDLSK